MEASPGPSFWPVLGSHADRVRQQHVDLLHTHSTPPPEPSPALLALLISPEAHHNPAKRSDFAFPPTLPPHADPKSVEARQVGLLSPKRDKNLRWKWFSKLLAGVKAPMPPEALAELERVASGEAEKDEREWQPRGGGTPQNSAWRHRPRTLTKRLLRRQAKRLLADIPILERIPPKEGKPGEGRFVVKKSYWAQGRHPAFTLTEEDKKWIAK
jgi:hypothetical protein